jgi:hypothetical protein
MSFSEQTGRSGRSWGRRKNAQQRPKWKLVIWILLGASALCAMAWGIYIVVDRRNNKNGGYASKEEIEQVANDLNRKFKYLSISTPDPRSTVALVNENGKSEGDKPRAQYVISIQDKYVGEVSIFDAKQYVMNVLGDPQKVKDAPNLCGTIDNTLEANDEILKVLQDAQIRSQISLALWGIVDVGVEFTPPKIVQVEIAAALRKIFGIRAKKVEVLIKGYADGQSGPWKERLLSQPYHYDSVNVYMPLEPERLNWFEFIRKESPLPIQEYYTNEELPNLRAQFVKEEFVDRFLKHCDSHAETEVHILKGQADKTTAIHRQDRKVQIFVNIY